MKVIDNGHEYLLNSLDGDEPVRLHFVKREGLMYPGNYGHYAGTNLQEVFRACINRVKYLQQQANCEENVELVRLLRRSILVLEQRAAKRYGRPELPDSAVEGPIEDLPVCPKCGHIGCFSHG